MTLGRHSYIAGEYHEGETPVVVGDFTQIGEEFFVHGPDNMATVMFPNLTSNFRFNSWFPDWPPNGYSKGLVTIGNDVWIGRDVKIMTGVRVGNGAVVGAHSVVTKDVPSYSLVAGNPAVVKKMRFSEDIIEKLLEIKWWDWDDQTIKDRLHQMLDVNDFVKKYG